MIEKNTNTKKVLVMFYCIVIFVIVAMYLNKEVAYEHTEKHSPNEHTYAWSNLNSDNNMRYYQDENFESILGIDVSTHQGEIDWQQVKDSGVEFAIIRVGFRGYGNGKIVEDKHFIKNIKQATAAGIDLGFYFFSQAISEQEAKEEAQFVIERIKDYEVKYPIVFDMELVNGDCRIWDISTEQKTKIALAFCEEIKENGYTPMIYGSISWLLKEVLIDEVTKYPLWVAEYKQTPTFPYSFQMWQYTNVGKIDGINGNVDINLLFKNRD